MSKSAATPLAAPPGKLWGSYRLGRKLGSGSFGDTFLVVHVRTGEELAVKLESVRAKRHMLMYEARVLRYLQGVPGVANVHYCDVEGDYNVMVMDLLGPSLADLFARCRRRLSLKTVLMLADQMLYRVEHLHSKGFIHRDIKPANFLIGHTKSSSEVYMIDFGLAKQYRDLKTHRHIPYCEGKGFSGTVCFCSISAHLGLEQSRRDDLEAVGYVLMYFLRGQLPWQGIKADTRDEASKKILECKRSTPIETLCNGYPAVFAAYIGYCRTLEFDTRPDYAYLRRLFRDLFVREGYRRDGVFDWSRPGEAPEGADGDAAGVGDADRAARQVKPRQGMLRSLLRYSSKLPGGA